MHLNRFIVFFFMFHTYYVIFSKIFFPFSYAKFQNFIFDRTKKFTFRMSASRISKDTQCLLYAGVLVSGMKILIGIDIDTP